MTPKQWFMLGVKLYALAFVVAIEYSLNHNAYIISVSRPDKKHQRHVLCPGEVFYWTYADGEFVNLGYLLGRDLCRDLDKVVIKEEPTYGATVYG